MQFISYIGTLSIHVGNKQTKAASTKIFCMKKILIVCLILFQLHSIFNDCLLIIISIIIINVTTDQKGKSCSWYLRVIGRGVCIGFLYYNTNIWHLLVTTAIFVFLRTNSQKTVVQKKLTDKYSLTIITDACLKLRFSSCSAFTLNL